MLLFIPYHVLQLTVIVIILCRKEKMLKEFRLMEIAGTIVIIITAEQTNNR